VPHFNARQAITHAPGNWNPRVRVATDITRDFFESIECDREALQQSLEERLGRHLSFSQKESWIWRHSSIFIQPNFGPATAFIVVHRASRVSIHSLNLLYLFRTIKPFKVCANAKLKSQGITYRATIACCKLVTHIIIAEISQTSTGTATFWLVLTADGSGENLLTLLRYIQLEDPV
jgi:hypothetical protein